MVPVFLSLPGDKVLQVVSVSLAQKSWICVPREASVGRSCSGCVSKRVALKTALAAEK